MRKNLRKASACKINPRRKKRAAELLATIKPESKMIPSKDTGTPLSTKPASGLLPPVKEKIESTVQKAMPPTCNKFRRYIRHILHLVRGKWSFKRIKAAPKASNGEQWATQQGDMGVKQIRL